MRNHNPNVSNGNSYAPFAARLATDARWIVDQEVAGTTRRVVRIPNGRRRHTRSDLIVLTVLAVGQVRPVIGSTTLPAYAAWAASDGTIARVAMPSVTMQAACRSENR